MISHLRGTLVEKELTRAVIDVNGVGYEVLIPMSTYDRLPRIGKEAYLKTYQYVREDALQLYGFASDEERDLFVILISSVSGIGPKIGLSVLSSMSVTSLCVALNNNDVKTITRINGIGRKTAERLVVELRDKIAELAPAAALSGGAPSGNHDTRTAKAIEDAVSGLVTLGFKADTARKAISKFADKTAEHEVTAETLIKEALTTLSR
jgi:Holliday junction DNA helicase RuvA